MGSMLAGMYGTTSSLSLLCRVIAVPGIVIVIRNTPCAEPEYWLIPPKETEAVTKEVTKMLRSIQKVMKVRLTRLMLRDDTKFSFCFLLLNVCMLCVAKGRTPAVHGYHLEEDKEKVLGECTHPFFWRKEDFVTGVK